MRIHGRCGLGLLIVLWSVAAVAQQQAAPAQAAGAEPGVLLDVVVTPKNGGAPVAGLTQQDFTLTDNKAPQTITSFQAMGGSSAPVAVVVVIDDVNADYTTIGYARQEIDKFFKTNGGQLPFLTQIAIMTDAGTQTQNGFTKDGNQLAGLLDNYVVGLRSISRSAGFYGATDRLDKSLDALQELTAYLAKLPGRKLLLWVSPGWPILSGPNVQLSTKQQQNIFDSVVQISTSLRQARTTVYSIDPLGAADAASFHNFYYQSFLKGLRKPGQANLGNLALQVIATQSGGLVLNSSNDMAGLLKQAVDDGGAYYELSFHPVPDEPNAYHQIEVTVAKPGLATRTRAGYYSGK